MSIYRGMLLGCCLVAAWGCSSSKVTDTPDAGDAADATGAADAGDHFQAQLAAAAATWASAKQMCPAYTYGRSFRSVFGSQSNTIIKVENDAVTERHFVRSTPGYDAGNYEWDETGTAIGSHESSDFGPFPAETVEGLLSECATILANDPTSNMLFFDVDGRGVPVRCLFRPTNCSDDCTKGIGIDPFVCDSTPASDGGPQH